ESFQTAHAQSPSGYVAMLVDSADVVADVEKPWEHLKAREDDRWECPAGATEEQALLMTTCMETWIIADREALKRHYKDKLQESALPSVQNLEVRDRHKVQETLAHATRDCGNRYQKGKRAFEPLAELEPTTLETHLPSFARMRRILNE